MLVFVLSQCEVDVGFDQRLDISRHFRAGTFDFGNGLFHLFDSGYAIIDRRLHRLDLFGVRLVTLYSGLSLFSN